MDWKDKMLSRMQEEPSKMPLHPNIVKKIRSEEGAARVEKTPLGKALEDKLHKSLGNIIMPEPPIGAVAALVDDLGELGIMVKLVEATSDEEDKKKKKKKKEYPSWAFWSNKDDSKDDDNSDDGDSDSSDSDSGDGGSSGGSDSN